VDLSLQPRGGLSCRRHGLVTSTNSVAQAAFLEAGEVGVLHIASGQTEGRGRGGRKWLSPEGVGFYGSILFDHGRELERARLMPFVGALALAETLRRVADEPTPTLKWPNDVLLNGRKVGGILVEAAQSGERLEWVCLGLGVNLLQPESELPTDLDYPATSLLAETGRMVPPEEFAQILAPVLTTVMELLSDASGALLLDQYRRFWRDEGRRVQIIAPDRAPLEGVVKGLGAGGELLLETAAGVHVIFFGTLRYV
jgi:BirA family transcriptional regulator, biotin operon repressor / biotin---[acetyl-CoA-carboxylase] ligase